MSMTRHDKQSTWMAILSCLCAVLLPAATLTADGGETATALWQGVVRFPGLESRVVLKVDHPAEESPEVSILFPDQSDQVWPADTCETSEDRVRVTVARLRISFDGEIDSDGMRLAGRWQQNGRSQDVTFRRVEAVRVAARPQTPQPPFPYASVEVVYRNPAGPATLAGTLTLPKGTGPHPAVLLISGGGAQDRDGTLFRHKPFWVLADALTRQGIAVLRVDDRGVGKSMGDRASATSEDYASDVLAGVAFLKARKEIDPKGIGLLGHSEGGMIASIAAARSRDVAFVVMLASPGLPGTEYLLQYEVSTARSLGLNEEAIAAKQALQRRVLTLLAGEGDAAEIERQLRAILKSADPQLPEPRLEAGVRRFMSPWFRFMVRHDPGETLRQLRCPVLSLFGGKDVQVPPEGNAEAVQAALAQSHASRHSVQVLPGVNHFLQECRTGSPREYGEIEQTLSPRAMECICGWIRATVGGAGPGEAPAGQDKTAG